MSDLQKRIADALYQAGSRRIKVDEAVVIRQMLAEAAQ